MRRVAKARSGASASNPQQIILTPHGFAIGLRQRGAAASVPVAPVVEAAAAAPAAAPGRLGRLLRRLALL